MKFEIGTKNLIHKLDNFLTPISISDLSVDDRPLVYVNEAFTELTGYSRKDCIGKSCRFLQGPETDPIAVDEITKFLEARECIDVCLTNYRADGSKFCNLLTLDYLDFQAHRSLAIGFQYEIKPAAFRIEKQLEAVNGMVDLINTQISSDTNTCAWKTTRETIRIRTQQMHETLATHFSAELISKNLQL